MTCTCDVSVMAPQRAESSDELVVYECGNCHGRVSWILYDYYNRYHGYSGYDE